MTARFPRYVVREWLDGAWRLISYHTTLEDAVAECRVSFEEIPGRLAVFDKWDDLIVYDHDEQMRHDKPDWLRGGF